jgi:hypothetical protein
LIRRQRRAQPDNRNSGDGRHIAEERRFLIRGCAAELNEGDVAWGQHDAEIYGLHDPLNGDYMLRSAMIATAATLALSFAAAPPANAKVISKVQVTKIDALGNRVSKTRVTGTNVFGDKISKTRVVIDPAGPGKIIATRVTRTDAFGDKVSVTKVRKVGF